MVYQKIYNTNYFISELIKQCWAHNPADRLNIQIVCRVLKELVNSHPFVPKNINLFGEMAIAPTSGVSLILIYIHKHKI